MFEAADIPGGRLPPHLAELYDGQLGIEDGRVYANFVSSIDGIAAIECGKAPSGGIISGRNEADRFVMGLLRAFADAVVVGAGTVRAEGGRALWTPDFIFPAAAEGYRALRQSLGRQPTPLLVVVTARGDLDPSERALQVGALVLTTSSAADRLRKTLPPATEVRAVSDRERIPMETLLSAVRADGHLTILAEGGPTLFGEMVAADCVDELFLTVSPVLAGRTDDGSFGIIHGIDFGRDPRKSRLMSAHRHGSHLFMRYRLSHQSPRSVEA